MTVYQSILKQLPPFIQEAITDYTSRLREKAVTYLEHAWDTIRLPIPSSMVAPNMQMVLMPFISTYSENPVSKVHH